MERLSDEQFHSALGAIDARALASEGIDRFCSTSDWTLPAHEALMPPRELVVARDHDRYFVGAARTLDDGMRLWEPLEASWALASPFLGLSEPKHAVAVVDWLAGQSGWDVLIASGLLQGSWLLQQVGSQLAARFSLRIADMTPRYVVDLGPGVEAFLARRSRNFRRSLTKARARCLREGVSFESAHARSGPEGLEVFERLLAVERKSWKSREGAGIDQGRMGEFYRAMSERLGAAGRHRCWFARHGDDDIGYVLGAVRGECYRGLQFSYDDEHARLSLGNVMQLEQMHHLFAEGVTHYDLGSEAHYKQRWADRIEASPVLLAFRS
ncbi:MAG: GNAT family N-acetyltransferase [Deltaproteobacteria bacterium]|nr:GNAT family N-acetyltransferase [Deltaproteobacteria bacterium]